MRAGWRRVAEEGKHPPGEVEEVGVGEEDDYVVEPGLGRHLRRRTGAEGASAVCDYHSSTCGSDIRTYTNDHLHYCFDCIPDAAQHKYVPISYPRIQPRMALSRFTLISLPAVHQCHVTVSRLKLRSVTLRRVNHSPSAVCILLCWTIRSSRKSDWR